MRLKSCAVAVSVVVFLAGCTSGGQFDDNVEDACVLHQGVYVEADDLAEGKIEKCVWDGHAWVEAPEPVKVKRRKASETTTQARGARPVKTRTRKTPRHPTP